MNNTIKSNYRQFRSKGGMDAKQALRAAKTLAKFNELGEECVRMRAEEEQESYMDCHGEVEGYTDIHGRRVSAEQAEKELVKLLDRYGVWITISEYWDGAEWQTADSCGMHAGYKNVLSPFENWYVVDEMEAAIAEFERCQSRASVEAFA